MELGKLYFYTSTIRYWTPILSTYNLEPIIIDSFNFLHQRGCIKLYGFVIMPNHMHLILEQLRLNGKETPVASLMKYTSHQFEKVLKQNDPLALNRFRVDYRSRRVNFWLQHPDTFELFREKTIFQKLNYIHNNPLQEHWNLVKNPSDYLYSSARFYETGVKNFPFLYDYRDWQPMRVSSRASLTSLSPPTSHSR